MTMLSQNEALLDDVQAAGWFRDEAQFSWVRGGPSNGESTESWSLVQAMLERWLRDPSGCIDDDYDPPTPAAIRSALRCAQAWRRGTVRSPTRVAPIGDGGIVFEWQFEPTFIEVEIEGDGSVEQRSYYKDKLLQRSYLS
jgi:hypothetical protein